MVDIFAQVKAQNLTFLDKILTSEFVFNLKMLPFKIFRSPSPKERNGTIRFCGCLSHNKNDFQCCAMPYFVKGRLDIYEKLMRHNMKIIENPDVKKVIFDCATCFETVLKYPLSETAREKLCFETDFGKINVPYTFHKPCHMPQEIFEKLEAELKKDPYYRPLKEHDCCGFGGDFFIRHPFVAIKLSIKRAREIKKTGAKKVLTACPTCRWSLVAGKILSKFFN
jgi:Fe-S oxidoreductase